MEEFTDMGVAGIGESHNVFFRGIWITGKSKTQLSEDLLELKERKIRYKRIADKPPGYNDILFREGAITMLEVTDFWIKEIELELSK